MGGGGSIQAMINSLKANKRPKRKMYGSYKTYENSKDDEREERRIYQYAEASQEHLKRIRERFLRQHRVMFQKKVAVFTGCVIIGVIAMLAMFYG